MLLNVPDSTPDTMQVASYVNDACLRSSKGCQLNGPCARASAPVALAHGPPSLVIRKQMAPGGAG